MLQQLGTGQAVVTVMSEKGAPTPVAWTQIWAPTSTMGPTPAGQLDAAVAQSPLTARYSEEIDRESAYEVLAQRLEEGARREEEERLEQERAEEAQRIEEELAELEAAQLKAERERIAEERRLAREKRLAEEERRRWEKANPSLVQQVTESRVFKDFMRTASREIVRSIFGTGRRR